MIRTNVVYCDLESILDIRQGAMALLREDPEELALYMLSNEYNERVTDDLKYMTQEQYKAIVATGSLEILRGAMPSYALGCVVTALESIGARTTATKGADIGELWVNVYPFKLDEAAAEMLTDVLFYKFGSKNMVRLISMPTAEVTPNFINGSNIVTAFMYDLCSWLDANGQNLVEEDIRKVNFMFSPIMARKPTEEEYEQLEKDGYGDLFTFLSLTISPFMKITFLPVAFYNNFLTSKDIIHEYLKIVSGDVKNKYGVDDIDEDKLNKILDSINGGLDDVSSEHV